MKKIIAAAAGLMIAGTAMVASAAVEFSGDARARYEFLDMDNADNSSDFFSHRIRMKVKGTTAGGSYAAMRFRVADTWGQAGSISDNRAAGFTVDYAYVGVPLGCVELTAGRQPLNLLTGYFNDAGVDNVRVKYAQDGTTLVALYGVVNDDNGSEEIEDFAGTPGYDIVVPTDEEAGNGKDDLFAVAWMQDWTADWSTTVSLAYANFDYTDGAIDDAVMGVAAVAGQAGPVALAAELGYQEEGVSASDDFYNSALNHDDAFGIFATAAMDFDALGFTAVGAYAEGGYIFDAPVGFLLIGGDSQLTLKNYANVGALGKVAADDTYVLGLKTTYQATDDLGFLLNLGYANADFEADAAGDADLFEVSAQAAYTINDGTVLYARAGYADLDSDEAIAAGLSLELKF